jgi:hypothetical protein
MNRTNMRKLDSQLFKIINNVNNYNFIIINYKGIQIERFNNRNIYIYFIKLLNKKDDIVFVYNKSNKYYRLIIKDKKDDQNLTLVNEFFDSKVKDYFSISDLAFINRDDYPMSDTENEIIEILKKMDS